jgi:hypothetical protein
MGFIGSRPTGTAGYVKATISKSMLTDGENLQVSMDGKQFNYSITYTIDSWVVALNYSHNTHQISFHLETNVSPTRPIG